MNYNPYVMPSQQILQANGIESARQIRLAPNSSVLVADATAPIVYRCITDGVGVVNVEAFDIIPHMTQEQVEQKNINERLNRLEELYESIITRNESDDEKSKRNAQSDVAKKSTV